MFIYFVYILTNQYNTVLYTGSTYDLYLRVIQHKERVTPSFTNLYMVEKLVYFEVCESRREARYRERQIKKYKRSWKINMIEEINPDWEDLHTNITEHLESVLRRREK